MLSNCCASTATSPKRWYSTHGTITAASPHTAVGGHGPSTFGTTNGTTPLQVTLLGGEVVQPGFEQARAIV